MSANKQVNEVPTSLKRLVHLVVRNFYTVEDLLIMNIIMKHFLVSENDIQGLLKFRFPLIKRRLNVLKKDKFLKIKLKHQIGANNKLKKINYYFVAYKVSKYLSLT